VVPEAALGGMLYVHAALLAWASRPTSPACESLAESPYPAYEWPVGQGVFAAQDPEYLTHAKTNKVQVYNWAVAAGLINAAMQSKALPPIVENIHQCFSVSSLFLLTSNGGHCQCTPSPLTALTPDPGCVVARHTLCDSPVLSAVFASFSRLFTWQVALGHDVRAKTDLATAFDLSWASEPAEHAPSTEQMLSLSKDVKALAEALEGSSCSQRWLADFVFCFFPHHVRVVQQLAGVEYHVAARDGGVAPATEVEAAQCSKETFSSVIYTAIPSILELAGGTVPDSLPPDAVTRLISPAFVEAYDHQYAAPDYVDAAPEYHHGPVNMQ